MPFYRREETVSGGFDDFLQLLPTSGWAGLRVPEFPAPQAYRFLLDAVVLDEGDTLIGLRQLLTMGAEVTEGETAVPVYPFEREIQSPIWHFPDSTVLWTVTAQPESAPRTNAAGPFDQDTFVQLDTDTPALVYDTAHFPALPPAPGYLGLDGYTPPAMAGTPIMGFHDLRFRWQSNEQGQALRYQATRPTRFRFYCDLLQTNPDTRFIPELVVNANNAPYLGAALEPEDSFVQVFPAARYWRVAGGLLIERHKAASKDTHP